MAMRNMLRVQSGVQRMTFFTLLLLVFLHVCTCVWVGFCQFEEDRCWMSEKIASLDDGDISMEDDDALA
jgi:hypothetical protein